MNPIYDWLRQAGCRCGDILVVNFASKMQSSSCYCDHPYLAFGFIDRLGNFRASEDDEWDTAIAPIQLWRCDWLNEPCKIFLSDRTNFMTRFKLLATWEELSIKATWQGPGGSSGEYDVSKPKKDWRYKMLSDLDSEFPTQVIMDILESFKAEILEEIKSGAKR